MTKKESAAVINETAAYVGRNGGTRETSPSDAVVFEIETDFGPAAVSLIPSAASKGPPWLALRYRDMDQVREAIAGGLRGTFPVPFSWNYVDNPRS